MYNSIRAITQQKKTPAQKSVFFVITTIISSQSGTVY